MHFYIDTEVSRQLRMLPKFKSSLFQFIRIKAFLWKKIEQEKTTILPKHAHVYSDQNKKFSD